MTTTASAGTSDGTAGSSTGTQGAKAGSPTATPAESGRSRIEARMQELAGDAGGDDPEVQQPESGQETAGEDADPQGGKPKEGKGEGDEKRITQKALQERLGREKRKQDALREQLSASNLELSKAREAQKLLLAEIERLTEARRSGAAFDEKDEQIHVHELANTARERAEQTQRAHEEAIARAAEEARLEAVREQLSEEIEGALEGTDGLIHRAELIGRMKLKENLGRTAGEIAQELLNEKLERARARLVPEKRPSPSTVREQRGGGSVRVNYANNRQGIAERIASLEAERG